VKNLSVVLMQQRQKPRRPKTGKSTRRHLKPLVCELTQKSITPGPWLSNKLTSKGQGQTQCCPCCPRNSTSLHKHAPDHATTIKCSRGGHSKPIVKPAPAPGSPAPESGPTNQNEHTITPASPCQRAMQVMAFARSHPFANSKPISR
jgi:hypothetical protein